jgi:hypothetical protein
VLFFWIIAFLCSIIANVGHGNAHAIKKRDLHRQGKNQRTKKGKKEDGTAPSANFAPFHEPLGLKGCWPSPELLSQKMASGEV